MQSTRVVPRPDPSSSPACRGTGKLEVPPSLTVTRGPAVPSQFTRTEIGGTAQRMPVPPRVPHPPVEAHPAAGEVHVVLTVAQHHPRLARALFHP